MFYLICFIILFALAVLNVQMHDKLSRQILSGFTALLLICIAGLRYETGGDWDTYTKIFATLPSFNHLIGRPAEFANIGIEEGFVLLCAFVKSLGGTVQHLFFVVTCINITLITVALNKYTKYPVVGLMCYYCLLYFQLEMIYIRQATAVALCFFALQYIQPKKIVPYMIFIIMACTFHRVAALMIPLYFFMNRKLSAWIYLTVIGIGAVIMWVGIPWIKTIFMTVAGLLGENYANKAESYTHHAFYSVNRGISVGFILNLAILAVVLFFKEKFEEHPFGTIMLNMFAASLVLYYYGYELIEVSNRVRLFFLIGIIVVFPLILEILPIFFERLTGLVIIALYCFVFSRFIFFEQPRAAAYNPYQNYIEYKIHPRPSTGKQRLEQSKQEFNNERKQ